MPGSSIDSNNMEARLLQVLCRKILQSDTSRSECISDDSVQRVFQYVLRILGSRLSASATQGWGPNADPYRVVELVQRHLGRSGRTADAVRASKLCDTITSSTRSVVTRKAAVLHFLLALSETDGEKDHDKLLAASGLRTVFSHNDVVRAKSIGAGADVMTDNMGDSLANMTLKRSSIGNKNKNENPCSRAYKYVAENRDNTSFEVPESLLLRDVVFVLQAIDGCYVKYNDEADVYTVAPDVGIPRPVRHTICKITELGWLYRRLRKSLDTSKLQLASGLVAQAFFSAVLAELNEYYRLIAVLQGQLNHGGEDGAGGLTLRRLVVWVHDPLQRLKVLATLVDGAHGLKGGAIASMISRYTQHGDPSVQSLVNHMLRQTSKPVYASVNRWIYEGELEDPYQEFFVAVNISADDADIWHSRYTLRVNMIPLFIGESLAHNILIIGKSLNFIRQACGDRDWVTGTYRRKMLAAAAKGAASGDSSNCGLEVMVPGAGGYRNPAFAAVGVLELQSITTFARRLTSERVLELLRDTFDLHGNLRALRRYLLLGQGDFVIVLMDLLRDDLAKPATSLYLHNLTGVLESAIRLSNAQFEEPDILSRLDVRLFEPSPSETGWDVFSLDFAVKPPLNAILGATSKHKYLQLFNFLWRLKRTECVLSDMWKEQMVHARALSRISDIAPAIHMCHVLRAEMQHLIYQTQYYFVFEVLECAWDELQTSMNRADDLDAVIAAHDTFIGSIHEKALLSPQERPLLAQLRSIYGEIAKLQSAAAHLHYIALDEASRRDDFERATYERTLSGEWGLTEQDVAIHEQRSHLFLTDILPDALAAVQVVGVSYRDMVHRFLGLLAVHKNPHLRYLCSRLNFNEYYEIGRATELSRQGQVVG